MLTEPLPTYDVLRNHRLTCILGIEAAERTIGVLPDVHSGPELSRLLEGYERRRESYKGMLALVEARIAALPKNEIYPTEAQTAFRTLVLARRAGQVTLAEFGQRAAFLRRAR